MLLLHISVVVCLMAVYGFRAGKQTKKRKMGETTVLSRFGTREGGRTIAFRLSPLSSLSKRERVCSSCTTPREEEIVAGAETEKKKTREGPWDENRIVFIKSNSKLD